MLCCRKSTAWNGSKARCSTAGEPKRTWRNWPSEAAGRQSVGERPLVKRYHCALGHRTQEHRSVVERRYEVMTRQEVRSVVLGKLLGRLDPGDTLWDIGAGLGTIAVECAVLRPFLEVLAVERDPA